MATKDHHWYDCLVCAAQHVDLQYVQEILMYSRDGDGLVWC